MEYCLCWNIEWLAHFIDNYFLWKIVSFVENDLEHFELTYFFLGGKHFFLSKITSVLLY